MLQMKYGVWAAPMPEAIFGSRRLITCSMPLKSKDKKKFTLKMCLVPFFQEKKKYRNLFYTPNIPSGAHLKQIITSTDTPVTHIEQ